MIAAAQRVLADGQPGLLEFGVTDEMAWDVGRTCGGRVRIFVEPVDEVAVLDALLAARQARQPAALITDPADGRQTPLSAAGPSRVAARPRPSPRCGTPTRDRSVTIEDNERTCVVHALQPAAATDRLGALQIALALARMVVMAGDDVTIIDPCAASPNVRRSASSLLIARLADDERSTVSAPMPQCRRHADRRSEAGPPGAQGWCPSGRVLCRRAGQHEHPRSPGAGGPRADGCGEAELAPHRRSGRPADRRGQPRGDGRPILAEDTGARRKGAAGRTGRSDRRDRLAAGRSRKCGGKLTRDAGLAAAGPPRRKRRSPRGPIR